MAIQVRAGKSRSGIIIPPAFSVGLSARDSENLSGFVVDVGLFASESGYFYLYTGGHF
jgi:hypothetical protein